MPGIYFGMYGNDIYPIILDTMILPLHRHYIACAFIGTKVLYFVYMGGESSEAPVFEPIESSRTMWCTPRLDETTPDSNCRKIQTCTISTLNHLNRRICQILKIDFWPRLSSQNLLSLSCTWQLMIASKVFESTGNRLHSGNLRNLWAA